MGMFDVFKRHIQNLSPVPKTTTEPKSGSALIQNPEFEIKATTNPETASENESRAIDVQEVTIEEFGSFY